MLKTLIVGACATLIAGGAFAAAHTAAPAALILMVISLWRALREDQKEEEQRERELRRRMRNIVTR